MKNSPRAVLRNWQIHVTLEPLGQDAHGVGSDPALYLGSKLKLEQ